MLRQLVEVVPIGVTAWRATGPADDELELLWASTSASSLLGLDLGAHIGEPVRRVLPDLSDEVLRLMSRACRQRERLDLGTVIPSARADTVPLTLSAAPVGHAEVAMTIERSRLSRADLGGVLDSFVEMLPAMVFVKRAEDLSFAQLNRAGEDLLGVSRGDLVGKTDYDLFPRAQADFFVANDRAVLSGGALLDIPEEPIATPRGTRWLHTLKIPILDHTGAPAYLLGVSIDITEKRMAEEGLRASNQELERRVAERTAALHSIEEQLRQAQKMEAIGRLAGGIAHDFNNLLSVVLSYAALIQYRMAPDDPLRGEVEEIAQAGRRAAQLTKQLLAFSRQQLLDPRRLDIGEIVDDMSNMLARLVGEDVRLDVRRSPTPCPADVDRGQFELVIMNLVVNARDAMPNGGVLTIQTGASAEHVTLSVSDTGIGMDEGVKERLFEPFFTTKPKGKGTGLGLSTVFGVVRQLDGAVSVDSAPGAGTRFLVTLPIARELPSSRPPVSLSEPFDLRGSECILLAEDEAQLRRLASTVLRGRGYQVLEARNGTEALALAAAHRGPIDLLLTDVVMPELGGQALAERLTSTHPGLRVLFMSGYTEDPAMRERLNHEATAFLPKPLTPETLARRVREVLDSPTTQALELAAKSEARSQHVPHLSR